MMMMMLLSLLLLLVVGGATWDGVCTVARTHCAHALHARTARTHARTHHTSSHGAPVVRKGDVGDGGASTAVHDGRLDTLVVQLGADAAHRPLVDARAPAHRKRAPQRVHLPLLLLLLVVVVVAVVVVVVVAQGGGGGGRSAFGRCCSPSSMQAREQKKSCL